MYIPDRIRIEYDGALHPRAAARVVDLDTGQEVPHILEVRLVVAKGRLTAYLDFYDMEASKDALQQEIITRTYTLPDLDMHHERPVKPAKPGA